MSPAMTKAKVIDKGVEVYNVPGAGGTMIGLSQDEILDVKGAKTLSREDLRRSWRPWLRGTALRFPFGAMPTGGAEIPTFLSYATERRLARGKAKEEFGKGAIEGVAGPEAANNAAFTGVLVPLLTIGIPTSATAAILVAASRSSTSSRGRSCSPRSPTSCGR